IAPRDFEIIFDHNKELSFFNFNLLVKLAIVNGELSMIQFFKFCFTIANSQFTYLIPSAMTSPGSRLPL
ncbi:MAG TPA: hypothetical protein VGI82_13205, partial [Chitinophagaceae bacterium]